jgi:hypothetical protein
MAAGEEDTLPISEDTRAYLGVWGKCGPHFCCTSTLAHAHALTRWTRPPRHASCAAHSRRGRRRRPKKQRRRRRRPVLHLPRGATRGRLSARRHGAPLVSEASSERASAVQTAHTPRTPHSTSSHPAHTPSQRVPRLRTPHPRGRPVPAVPRASRARPDGRVLGVLCSLLVLFSCSLLVGGNRGSRLVGAVSRLFRGN